MKKFQISHNRSLDGVLDFLNSKYDSANGPIDQIDDEDSASDVEDRYFVFYFIFYSILFCFKFNFNININFDFNFNFC